MYEQPNTGGVDWFMLAYWVVIGLVIVGAAVFLWFMLTPDSKKPKK